jgi:protein involved in polysaccharide export with SLBB domain
MSAPGSPAMPPVVYSTAPLYVPGQMFHNSRPFTGVPAWMQNSYVAREGEYPPFGANLFQGYFAGTFYEGINSDYVIMPGDRILIHIWGAQAYSDTLMVDQQGNIFLPEVGPVQVAGLKNGQLQGAVRSYIASVFRANMEVYVNLLTAQPVAVYVTGFVARPGRYAGGVNDSVLYFLDRAGGIIPDRGSYRNITIQRHNREIARVDLYSFILNGKIAGGALQDGDVIVVGTKGDSVMAGGNIPQQASYESLGKRFTGLELARFAAPQSSVSHVSVTGTRDTLPFHVYLTLDEFRKFFLAANDKVEFLADRPGRSIMVAVSGATTGATRYPVTRSTGLRNLLAYVPVDGTLSNLSGIYVKRKSVVEQQRKAIADALRRLESSVLTATSANQEGAAIRVQEAQLVQNFAARVAQLEPDGVVVVTRNDVTSDILLEDGDEIVIPQRSDVVQVNGEVMSPKAVVHVPGQGVKKYVQDAGGFTDRADTRNILVVHPNGEIVPADRTKILAGDVLLVMPEYDSKGFSIFKDIVQVLYQVAIATRVVIAPW